MKKIFTFAIALCACAVANAQTYKSIAESYVLLPTQESIDAIVAEGWATAGITPTNKSGNIDPTTGETLEAATSFPGIQLKQGGSAKNLTVYVTNVSEITAYGVTSSSSETRTLRVIVTPEGETATTKDALTSPKVSTTITSTLDPTKNYSIQFDGLDEAASEGADVCLYGIKFVAGSGTTAIKSTSIVSDSDESPAYNLGGSKVYSTIKGVSLQGGKKLIAK